MKTIFRSWFRARNNTIRRRLDNTRDTATSRPVFSERPIDYEVAHRHRAIAHGGIGGTHALVQHLGLPRAIDERLHLLKVHLPYYESDHVLNIAYNPLCHGTCLQDLELRRNDDAFLDALGARRIPDPTTAGDFCRRFTQAHIDALQDAVDVARRKVWAEQAYPAQLQERSTAMGKPVTNLRSDFSPKRLQWFMQGEISDYCQSHPDVKRFSAHAFRKRAMTVAWQLDIPLEKAALAFGCNPTTMRAHYIALDETATADEVLSAIASVVKPSGVTALEPATEKKSSESALPQGDSAA